MFIVVLGVHVFKLFLCINNVTAVIQTVYSTVDYRDWCNLHCIMIAKQSASVVNHVFLCRKEIHYTLYKKTGHSALADSFAKC